MKRLFLATWCLVRREHFGTLILLSYWKRFRVDNKFFDILKYVHWKTLEEILALVNLNKEEIINFISDCKKKWIISNTPNKKQPRIIENEYISDDCLSFPRTVYRECTRKCNYKCIHCYSSSWVNTKGEIPFTIVKKLIDEISKYWWEFFNIWGWEPLLYPKIYSTIAYAKKKGIPTEITTNWFCLDDTNIQKLKKSGLKFIQVSIDWASQEIYWKIRIGGEINKVKKNIEKLIAAWFVVSICTVVNKINYNEIFDIIDLCIKMWVQYYRILPCIEVGRGSEITNLQISKTEFQELYKKILHLSDQDLQWLKISFNENLVVPNRKNIDWMPEDHYGCSAGRTTCWIDAYGNVYPCSYMLFDKLLCGNIKEQSLMDIWRQSNVMSDIRKIGTIYGKCHDCSYLKLCRGGCRAAAYAKHNSLDAEDPLCSII